MSFLRGCGISAAWIPEENGVRLRETVEEKGFRLTGPEDGNFPVCTCETSEVHDLAWAPADAGTLSR